MAISDLSIFKQDHSVCTGAWEECLPTGRLLVSLKYYSIASEDIFCNFIDEVYDVQMLDDYAHFIREHDRDLYAINQTLMKNDNACSIKTCLFSSRHHQQRNESDKNEKIKNEKHQFYTETMDSLHYHLVHLFECGMRINKNDQTTESDDVETDYFDAEFAQMVKNVGDKRQNTQSFDRFTSITKFTLNNDDDFKSALSTTFLEEVDKRLSSESFSSLVKHEDFETDSVKMDTIDAKANLFEVLIKEDKIKLIQAFIAMVNLQNNTFSIGYRFHYWDACTNFIDVKNESWNNNEYGGYDEADLYVSKKYQDFKHEIMSYKYVTLEHYQHITAKANQYLQTKNAKRIKAKDAFDMNEWYGIATGTLLCVWNLIALILYTDYTKHCSEFSASFRKLSAFESLKVTKERNRNFWWMAKTLRETVEIFGKSRFDGMNDKEDAMFGPFYTGVNRKMVVSQFNIRLCAPTSTTASIEVACNFAKSDGTILTLNNDSDSVKFGCLRGFDVSWLSKFKEENERLFCGGYYMMRLQSIRLTRTKQNFGQLISPLYYFDALITGKQITPWDSNLKITENGIKVIKHLIKYKMTQKKDEKMDEYIYKCFDAFVKNKESLTIALHSRLADVSNDCESH